MNSLNPNSVLSNFSNYQRKDTHMELNFNQFPEQNQNSQSIGFTLFNHFNKNPIGIEKTEALNQKILTDQNADPKDATIGFNHLTGFFENSMKFSAEQFKAANLKKAPTFQFNQGYLNSIHDHCDSIRQNVVKIQSKPQIGISNSVKSKEHQISVKRALNQRVLIPQKQTKIAIKIKEQHINCPAITKKMGRRSRKNHQTSSNFDYNLQNLKSIAKVAYQGIRFQKISTYKAISDLMLEQMQKQWAFLQRSENNSSEAEDDSKKNKKNELIQSMIQNKSFSQIKQMKQIQQNDLTRTSVSRRIISPKKKDHRQFSLQNQSNTSIKNIRRRLYDAINVMIAANVIQKNDKGDLALKLTIDKKSGPKDYWAKKQDLISFEQIQNQVKNVKQRIQAKKKYRELLATKYLIMQKHIEKNKIYQKRTPEQAKLSFPLIFTGLQAPSRVNIHCENNNVDIESKHKIDVMCDMDALSYIYMVQRDRLKRKQELLQSHTYNNNGMAFNDSLKKKVKLNEQSQYECKFQYECNDQ